MAVGVFFRLKDNAGLSLCCEVCVESGGTGVHETPVRVGLLLDLTRAPFFEPLCCVAKQELGVIVGRRILSKFVERFGDGVFPGLEVFLEFGSQFAQFGEVPLELLARHRVEVGNDMRAELCIVFLEGTVGTVLAGTLVAQVGKINTRLAFFGGFGGVSLSRAEV